jgi:putative heme-binding domain-containing protein
MKHGWLGLLWLTALQAQAPAWICAFAAPLRSELLAPVKAPAATALTVLPGFKAELVRSAGPGEGSWACLGVDDRGRLIISSEEPALPWLQVTVSGAGSVGTVEPIATPVRQAQGWCYGLESLFVVGDGPLGAGLYRLTDADHNDQFEAAEARLLKKLPGQTDGAWHAVVVGPDQMLYILGNCRTPVPEGLSTNSPHRHYGEDSLLPCQREQDQFHNWRIVAGDALDLPRPRRLDPDGQPAETRAPGGWVARADPDGQRWELLLGGLGCANGLDFNGDGEWFSCESATEPDWGLPWWRPARVLHGVSGGEYGWRAGTGNWPTWSPDSLPAALELGLGWIAGVKFGAKSSFPANYQSALFVLDWRYGRILAVHLRAQGATYSGTAETLLHGLGLHPTDLAFGPDGAMYFITGGGGAQSGLYRVSSLGQTANAAATPEAGSAPAARALRRRLETFHGRQDPAAVDFAWPHLGSEDGWIRYAARVAVESQPVAWWQERALAETNLTAAVTALLALARVGSRDLQPALVRALDRLEAGQPAEAQTLAGLRVLELAFVRLGRPEENLRQGVLAAWLPMYPAPSERLNRELCQLLVYLEAPEVVARTLALLDSAPTLEEQIHYVFHLRTLKPGWTLEQRRAYFHWLNRVAAGGAHPAELHQWFEDVGREYANGPAFAPCLAHTRQDAVATLATAELAELMPIITGQAIVPAPEATQRSFVKEWKVEDILPALEEVGRGRSFANGEAAFTAGQCITCHRFGDAGGSVGPDLTAAAFRLSRRDLLESILKPSQTVAEQYRTSTVTRKDGDELVGRIVAESEHKIIVVTNALTGQRTEVQKRDVETITASKLSPMPQGLADILTREQILDLLAYLESSRKAAPAALNPGP